MKKCKTKLKKTPQNFHPNEISIRSHTRSLSLSITHSLSLVVSLLFSQNANFCASSRSPHISPKKKNK